MVGSQILSDVSKQQVNFIHILLVWNLCDVLMIMCMSLTEFRVNKNRQILSNYYPLSGNTDIAHQGVCCTDLFLMPMWRVHSNSCQICTT